ncbi:hypothetical protein SKAU_G00056640 [Synaphobranchus kaupii]|uniref:Uncharacterized protein n=1 Tax=Synaphobranchus kaupii TaxID=118154 RepID=A0A9Q1G545_SYNKA|nr:hypothetical protein SKAU_G00056640 [Synaphobranchus kaupii]
MHCTTFRCSRPGPRSPAAELAIRHSGSGSRLKLQCGLIDLHSSATQRGQQVNRMSEDLCSGGVAEGRRPRLSADMTFGASRLAELAWDLQLWCQKPRGKLGTGASQEYA